MQRNHVELMGYLGVDPQQHTSEGRALRVTFTLATREFWRNNGEKREHVEWHRVVAWGKTAEFCSAHLRKGQPVFVEGRLRSRRWTDSKGVHHTGSEVHLLPNGVQFLSPRPLDEKELPTRDPNREPPGPPDSESSEESTIPEEGLS